MGVAAALCVLLSLLVAFTRLIGERRRQRSSAAALREGDPRGARALARLLARDARPAVRARYALDDMAGLLWQGDFARAIDRLDRLASPVDDPELRLRAVVLRLEALLFDVRADEARTVFDAHVHALTTAREGVEVAAIKGFLLFHEGALAPAQEALLRAAATTASRAPIARAAHLCLAEIAQRQARRADARTHLLHAAMTGGDLFVVALARAQLATLFPDVSPLALASTARPRSRPGRLRRNVASLASHLWLGVGLLSFRIGSLRTRIFTADQVAVLVVLDVAIALATKWRDYTPKAMFLTYGLAPIAMPIPLFVVTAYLVTRRLGRLALLRVLGAFFAALPILLVLGFQLAREPLGRSVYVSRAELAVALWCVAVVVRILMAVARPAGVPTLLGGVVLFVVTWLVPMHYAAGTRIFFTPSASFAEAEALAADHDARVFEQADRVVAAEATLAAGRPGVTDLYFVGAAGYAQQDVFGREVASARALFDDRFDTRGRSLVLANEPQPRDELPLASSLTLRHALKAVGARMDRDDDILFLFMTSHGSRDGLWLTFPKRSTFESETLTPDDLRSMLHDAGIKWRVLVIAGCESGAFVTPLQDDYTLIATAAAGDRSSYGCAMGNAYTDFGRAVFADELPRERSFLTAFTNASATIARQERDDQRLASYPQIAEGKAIGAKLRALEERIGAQSSR